VLRGILGFIGVAAFVVSLLAIFFGAPLFAVLWLLGIGLVLTLGLWFERVHYKALASKPPGPGWVATPERFVDPTSGRTVQVYTKPETGERLYVDVDAAASGGPGISRT
jgi:hypothetical protein